MRTIDREGRVPAELLVARHLERVEARILRTSPEVLKDFAETVVAVGAGGWAVDRTAARHDVVVPRPRPWPTHARVTVKCSRHVRSLRRHFLLPTWGVLKKPANGFQSDVFVFADHEGEELDRGWQFHVMPTGWLERALGDDRATITLHWLFEQRAARCDYVGLRAKILTAARQG